MSAPRTDDATTGAVLRPVRPVGRLLRVVAWLNQHGYDAVNVAGGMLAWEAEGRPLVTDSDDPARVL